MLIISIKLPLNVICHIIFTLFLKVCCTLHVIHIIHEILYIQHICILNIVIELSKNLISKNLKMKKSLFLCVGLFVLSPLLFPYRGDWTQALSSECKIDQAGLADWMSLIPSNFINEISPNPEVLIANT